jgi:hypothetical protein
MFSNLMPWQRQTNNACEEFGSMSSQYQGAERWSTFSRPIMACPIAPHESRRVLTPLLCLFFSAQKFLPLTLMGGIVIELELDS